MLKPENLADIKTRYLAGESLVAIGRLYNKDHTTVLYHVKQMGLWRPFSERQESSPRIQKRYYVPHPRSKNPYCCIPGCTSEPVSRDFCNTHYNQIWRDGGFTSKRSIMDTIDCDHSSSRCECVNMGMDYATHLRHAKYKTAKLASESHLTKI